VSDGFRIPACARLGLAAFGAAAAAAGLRLAEDNQIGSDNVVSTAVFFFAIFLASLALLVALASAVLAFIRRRRVHFGIISQTEEEK